MANVPVENYLTGTFFGNTILQYLTFFGIIIGSIIMGRIVYYAFTTIVKVMTKKTKTELDDIFIDIIEEPIVFTIVIIGFFYGYQQLTLADNIAAFMNNVTKNLITLALAWFIIKFVDKMIEKYLSPLTSKTKSDLDDHIVPLVRKAVKYSLIALTIVLILSNFGYNVTSIIAGLGIGGLAVALAAQETLKNILGGITLITDRPFKLGDWIEVDQFSGSVEEIGLRSTRLKTLTGEYVAIPNAIMSSTATTNYKRYSRRKITFVIGLTYDTSAEKIEEAKKLIRDILGSTEMIVRDSYEINFVSFNAYSQDIDIRFSVKTNSGVVMREIKDDVNLKIKRAFKKAKIEMAFPTQTIYVEK